MTDEQASGGPDPTQNRAASTNGSAAGAVPPSGWEIPRSEHRQRPPELDALAQALAQLLTAIPEELQTAVSDAARTTTDALRALLEAVGALLDWLASLLERLGGNGGADANAGTGRQVHDIPIL